MSLSGEFADYEASPVRRYVITSGRSRPSRNTVKPDTLLIVSGSGRPLPVKASKEERDLLGMCQQVLSLAEAAVHLKLPVSVVSVVASDLIDGGYLTVHVRPGEPGLEILKDVLDGLLKIKTR